MCEPGWHRLRGRGQPARQKGERVERHAHQAPNLAHLFGCAPADIEAVGGHAVVIPLGASKPLGSLGYVRAAAEIDVQPRDHPHAGDTWIFVSVSYSTPRIRPRLPRECWTRPRVAAYYARIGWSSGTPEDTVRPWHSWEALHQYGCGPIP